MKTIRDGTDRIASLHCSDASMTTGPGVRSALANAILNSPIVSATNAFAPKPSASFPHDTGGSSSSVSAFWPFRQTKKIHRSVE
eukprot:31232-Pelagococcus_subviridis.AAC.5